MINRITPFASSDFEKRVDLDDITWDSVSLVVERIVRVFFKDNEFKLVVQWLGFESCSNTTEPLTHLYEYIPEMIKIFLKSPRGYGTLQKRRQDQLRSLIKRLGRPDKKSKTDFPANPMTLSKVHVDELQSSFYRDLDPRVKLQLLSAKDASDKGGSESDGNQD